MDLAEAFKGLMNQFPDLIQENRPLSDLNTFGTGGSARLFADVTTTEELAKVTAAASKLGVPIFMLGGGSNILVSDRGFDGLIIKNSILGKTVEDNSIICGAGENLQDLIDFATASSLSGLEFASGIWGTVGGAIYGNAGAYGAEIKDILEWAELVDRKGNIRIEKNRELGFEYRHSILKKSGEFVARAKFSLKSGQKDAISDRVKEIIAIREEKLPLSKPSAGCFFKNIPDKSQEYGKLSAGKLLDQIGAKEMHCGEAAVFEKHANILINNGSATSSEIRELSRQLKKRVKEKFNIELQEEIILLGEFEEEKVSNNL